MLFNKQQLHRIRNHRELFAGLGNRQPITLSPNYVVSTSTFDSCTSRIETYGTSETEAVGSTAIQEEAVSMLTIPDPALTSPMKHGSEQINVICSDESAHLFFK